MAYIRGVFHFDTTLVFTTKSFAPHTGRPDPPVVFCAGDPGYNTSETVDRDIIYFIHPLRTIRRDRPAAQSAACRSYPARRHRLAAKAYVITPSPRPSALIGQETR